MANAPPVVGGGGPLLFQHLFWFYSHPAVYVMILPAMGMVSDIIATFSRKPLFGYKPMVFAIAGIAGLGFIVWGHHMFQSGMNPALGATFMLSTMMIALPSAIKVFNWLGTMWGGRLQYTAAMLNAMAFVAMFIIGGLSGIFMAATPVDMHIHDTYFIVGHLHYVLFGGSMFAHLRGDLLLVPQDVRPDDGRAAGPDPFLPHVHLLQRHVFPDAHRRHARPSRAGSPTRRLMPTCRAPASSGMNQFMTINAFLLGLTQLIFAYNFFYSLVAGPKAPANPWHANTLEWATTSPPRALQLRADPDRLPCSLRIQRAGDRGRLPASDPAPAGERRSARPGHGVTSSQARANIDAVPQLSKRKMSPDRSTTTFLNRPPRRYRRGPHWIALFAAVFTLPLLYVGGSVTTYRVGLAVPDWPTTFGDQHVPVRLLECPVRRSDRARAPALWRGRRPGHDAPGGLVPGVRAAAVDEGAGRAGGRWP